MSLCDVGGFTNEPQSHIAVFNNSYVVEKILRLGNEFKIVLGLSHSKFKEEQIGKLMAPLIGFINVFYVDLLLK
jgi:hypothetical protein